MSDRHVFADELGALLSEIARPRINALRSEHNAAPPSGLPRAKVGKIMQQVLVETTSANFPTANFEALDHGFRSFLHPAFMPAWDRVRSLTATGGDAFSMASGADAAVLLAGFGLPIAPFDLEALRILAKPSKDIDTVLALFSRNKTALVGYSACDAPFYVLLTDCIRTLRQRVPTCPELADIKQLFGRSGGSLPPDPGSPYAKVSSRRGFSWLNKMNKMGVVVEMVDVIGVEEARAPQAVDLVAFREQKLGKVGAVLPGNAADQCPCHPSNLSHFDHCVIPLFRNRCETKGARFLPRLAAAPGQLLYSCAIRQPITR
jgi:hypothetical protein